MFSTVKTIANQIKSNQIKYYTEDNLQNTHSYTPYTQCTIRHTYSYQYSYQYNPKLSFVIKKFGSGSIFCVFESVACILIGKDDKKMQPKISDSVCNDLY